MVITKIQKYSFIMPSFSQNALELAFNQIIQGLAFADDGGVCSFNEDFCGEGTRVIV
jgi:hypothetical protein